MSNLINHPSGGANPDEGSSYSRFSKTLPFEGGQNVVADSKGSLAGKGRNTTVNHSADPSLSTVNSLSRESVSMKDDDPNLGGVQSVSIHRFFAYNSGKDNLMLAIGTLGAILAGLLLPSISLIMGQIATLFGDGDI